MSKKVTRVRCFSVFLLSKGLEELTEAIGYKVLSLVVKVKSVGSIFLALNGIGGVYSKVLIEVENGNAEECGSILDYLSIAENWHCIRKLHRAL